MVRKSGHQKDRTSWKRSGNLPPPPPQKNYRGNTLAEWASTAISEANDVLGMGIKTKFDFTAFEFDSARSPNSIDNSTLPSEGLKSIETIETSEDIATLDSGYDSCTCTYDSPMEVKYSYERDKKKEMVIDLWKVENARLDNSAAESYSASEFNTYDSGTSPDSSEVTTDFTKSRTTRTGRDVIKVKPDTWSLLHEIAEPVLESEKILDEYKCSKFEKFEQYKNEAKYMVEVRGRGNREIITTDIMSDILNKKSAHYNTKKTRQVLKGVSESIRASCQRLKKRKPKKKKCKAESRERPVSNFKNKTKSNRLPKFTRRSFRTKLKSIEKDAHVLRKKLPSKLLSKLNKVKSVEKYFKKVKRKTLKTKDHEGSMDLYCRSKDGNALTEKITDFSQDSNDDIMSPVKELYCQLLGSELSENNMKCGSETQNTKDDSNNRHCLEDGLDFSTKGGQKNKYSSLARQRFALFISSEHKRNRTEQIARYPIAEQADVADTKSNGSDGSKSDHGDKYSNLIKGIPIQVLYNNLTQPSIDENPSFDRYLPHHSTLSGEDEDIDNHFHTSIEKVTIEGISFLD